MRHRIVFIHLLLAVLFVAVAPTAMASSTWYVDGVNGSDSNNCKTRQHACKTIGHAISLASSGDSISIAAATYAENLTISFSLKMSGGSAATTIIDGAYKGTVVTISKKNAHVTLSQVTIRNGRAGNGGGISNSGSLKVIKSTIQSNFADVGMVFDAGGGISNFGTLSVIDSSIDRNGAFTNCKLSFCRGGFGGGISNSGTLTITNSTVSRNDAGAICGKDCEAYGGGIYRFGGTVTINNSTINGNGASVRYGCTHCSARGGGIGGTAILQNSIVANSVSGGNCYGTMTSNGYNLSSDNTCDFNSNGDLNNTDPKLGQLGNNGGPTQTLPLLSGSPAIDAGNPSGCTDGHGHLLKTDQRGKPRPDKEDTGGCDMGAYERQSD